MDHFLEEKKFSATGIRTRSSQVPLKRALESLVIFSNVLSRVVSYLLFSISNGLPPSKVKIKVYFVTLVALAMD